MVVVCTKKCFNFTPLQLKEGVKYKMNEEKRETEMTSMKVFFLIFGKN